MRDLGWVVAVALLAAAPRIVWFRAHQPELPPDTGGYLNVAREWRGQRAPDGMWDDRAQLPSNNLAARTPGYPLFLDLVFAITDFSRTPDSALVNARRVLRPVVGGGARAAHLRHLETDENVRAVQAAQHLLGVLATVLVFLTMLAWSTGAGVAALGSIASIGWNPVWIMTLEPSMLGETLAGVLLIVAIWLVSTRRSLASDVVAALVCAASVVVRPAMVFAVAPVVAYAAFRQRRTWFGAPVLAAAVVVLALLVVNNGVRYGYWGVTSLGGTTVLSHANDHAAALREPARDAALRFHPYLANGSSLQYMMATDGGRPFLDVSDELNRAAVGYVLDHPIWYLTSVGGALIDYFSPPLRYVGGDFNLLRQRLPTVWLALSICATALLVAGLAALAMDLPLTAKLGPAAFLVCAVGTSLVAHTENRRFAAPVVPLVLMSGTLVLQRATRAVAK